MTLVMQFGLLPPIKGEDVVQDQLRKANKYRCALVRVERERRALVREVETAAGIPALITRLLECLDVEDSAGEKMAKDAIDAVRSTDEYKARMVEINGEKVEGKLSAKERRARKDPNNSISAIAKRKARSESGLYWGTYLICEKAHGDSCSDTPLWAGTEPNDPDFPHWNGEGQLAVQIQSKQALSGADLFGDDKRVQIKPVDMLALTSPVRSERRKAGRTTLRMRVGPDDEYAEWPMILHRPIPADSRVTGVAVSARRCGPRIRWSCEITLNTVTRESTPIGSGTAAIVFGWRRHGDKIQVAQWLSATGETGVLELTNTGLASTEIDGGKGGIIDGIRKSHDLHAIRDRKLLEARDSLVEWLRTLPNVPEWIRKRTGKRHEDIPTTPQALAYLSQWKSPARLAGLARAWAKSRFEGDSPNGDFDPRDRNSIEHLTGFGALEAWRYHDFHLWKWESNQGKSSERRRNNVYRVFAANMASKFSRLLVDGTNYKEVKELKPKLNVKKRGPKRGPKPKTMQHMVAPGALREVLKLACDSRSVSFEKQKVAGSALRCPKCGAKHKAHKGDDGMFACSECPFVRDVPMTRLLNMLADDGCDVTEIIDRQDEVLNKMREVVL